MSLFSDRRHQEFVRLVTGYKEGRAKDQPTEGDRRMPLKGIVIAIKSEHRTLPPLTVRPDDDPVELAETVWGIMQDHADGTRMAQSFSVGFTFGTDRVQRRESPQTFEPAPPGDDELWPGSPTADLRRAENRDAAAAGLTLRTVEEMQRTLVRMTEVSGAACGYTMSHMTALLDRQQTALDRANEENRRYRGERENLLDRSLDREMKRHAFERGAKRDEQIDELLFRYAPVGVHLLDQFVADKTGIKPDTVDETMAALLSKVADSPEKLQKLVAALELSEEDTQKAINLVMRVRAAQARQSATRDAKAVLSGVPRLVPVSEFKRIVAKGAAA